MSSHRHTDAPPPPLVAVPAVADDPILEAARHVIMTRGPRRATLTEVARQAGVSRMTVYRRFESFDRLMSALLTQELAGILGDMPQPEGETARSRVVALVVAGTEAIADHPLVRRVLAVDPEYLTPLMVSRFGQTQRSAADLLAPLLAAGMASRGGDGSIRDADPAALALAGVVAVQSFIFAAPALSDRPEGPEVRRQLHPLINGLLRPLTDGDPS